MVAKVGAAGVAAQVVRQLWDPDKSLDPKPFMSLNPKNPKNPKNPEIPYTL